jgi:hypothetical protein
MRSEGKASLTWRRALFGAAVCALVGLALQVFPGLGGWLAHWSYDLAAMLRPRVAPPEEVVIVYMDEKSFSELGQDPKSWDRKLHAALIDRLARDPTTARHPPTKNWFAPCVQMDESCWRPGSRRRIILMCSSARWIARCPSSRRRQSTGV